MLKNLLNLCSGNAFASGISFFSLVPILKIYGFEVFGEFFILQSYTVVISCILSLGIDRSIVFLKSKQRVYLLHFSNICFIFFILISLLCLFIDINYLFYALSVTSYIQYTVNLQYDISLGNFKRSKYIISFYAFILLVLQLSLCFSRNGLIYSYIITNFILSFRYRTLKFRTINISNIIKYRNSLTYTLTFLFPIIVNRLSNQLVGILFPYFLNPTDLGVFGAITKVLRFPSRVVSKNIYLVLAQRYKTAAGDLNVKLLCKIFFYIFGLSLCIYGFLYFIVINNTFSPFIEIPHLEYINIYFISFLFTFTVSPFIFIFGMLSKQHYLSYLYTIKLLILSLSLLTKCNVILSYSIALICINFITIIVLIKIMPHND